MIMRVMRSWRDSLALLAPSSLKPLALVTLKSIIDTYKVLFRVWYVWLVPVVIFIAKPMQSVLLHVLIEHEGISSDIKYIILSFWATLLLFFQLLYTVTIALAARASVKKKNITYFLGYTRYLVLLFFAIIVASYGISLMYFYSRSIILTIFVVQQETFFVELLAPASLGSFYILFFLDSDGSIKALWMSFIRTLKLLLFNLPLLIVVQFLIGLIFYGIKLILPFSILALILPILFVITICIWNTIYIKRLHDQPDVYFNQPK